MRVIAWICIPLLIVAAGFVALSLLVNDVVTSRYATLADARADNLFERGWLPDILPNSARQIRTSNDLDVSISEGEFRFALGDYEQFSSRLRPYIEVEEPGAWSAERVVRKTRGGFEAGTYSDEGSTWVFFCRPAEGFCEYTMWMRKAPSELVPTG
jgi:hypothetical protein